MHLLNNSLDDGYRFFSRRFSIGKMGPTTLFPDIGYLTMIGVYAFRSSEIAKGALM